MKKNLDYYRSLPYTLKLDRFEEEEDGEIYFCAYFEQLPHVKGVHPDRLMAIKLAKELFDSYVEAQLAWGEEIPEPSAPRSRKVGGLYKLRALDSPSGAPDASGGLQLPPYDRLHRTKQKSETTAAAPPDESHLKLVS